MGWIPDVELRALRVGDPYEAQARTLKNGQVTIVLSPI